MTQTFAGSAVIPNDASIALSVKGLCKSFAGLKAVDEVNLEVRQGEIFGFLGPNGAGKTTALSMILGLLEGDSGTIEIFGKTGKASLEDVGSLVGAPAIYPHLSAKKHLELLGTLHGGVPSGRIEEILSTVGLGHVGKKSAGSFSTGMKQRLGIAMALLNNARVLILDEPSNGMDPAGMKEMRDLLSKLAAEGKTVIFSSHILPEVEQICDRIAVINKGKIVAVGSLPDLLKGNESFNIRVDEIQNAKTVLEHLGANVLEQGPHLSVSGIDVKTAVKNLVQAGFVPTEVLSSKTDLEQLFLNVTTTGDA